ncbi:hypothetical protein SAY87_030391 [Trapa incisa]|uniref:Uncharacterized protein n=1 Tax=Trapa incisa TaxID=236973 RepID=A0AAN7KRR1_9MYRT|nr:hypothetical protein SAY87_030391 [Trapa incisa]
MLVLHSDSCWGRCAAIATTWKEKPLEKQHLSLNDAGGAIATRTWQRRVAATTATVAVPANNDQREEVDEKPMDGYNNTAERADKGPTLEEEGSTAPLLRVCKLAAPQCTN